MERRKLLQALTALPAMMIYQKDGEQIGTYHETKPDKNYVVFLNGFLVDVEEFCMPSEYPGPQAIPPGTRIHVIYPNSDQSMDEAIRIYEVDKA